MEFQYETAGNEFSLSFDTGNLEESGIIDLQFHIHGTIFFGQVQNCVDGSLLHTDLLFAELVMDIKKSIHVKK